MFFDDILVYSCTFSNHVAYLKVVFEVLRANHLKVKLFKCSLGQALVDYLGHTIFAVRVGVC